MPTALLMFTLCCIGCVDVAYEVNIKRKGDDFQFTMDVEKKSTTIGHVRQFIQSYTGRVPGRIYLGKKVLNDPTLLSTEPILDNPPGTIEYDVSESILLNGTLHFITPDGVKEKHKIEIHVGIGVRTMFADTAYRIKESLGAKNKWFKKQEVHYPDGPILFLFRNCPNDYVLIRDYPSGCTEFFLEDDRSRKSHRPRSPLRRRGMTSHNIYDILMLQEFFKIQLTARDALVWIPQQPTRTLGHYDHEYYVYDVNMAKRPGLVLHLKNDVKYKTKALKLNAMEAKRAGNEQKLNCCCVTQ